MAAHFHCLCNAYTRRQENAMLEVSAFYDAHAVLPLAEGLLTCPDDVLRVLAERLYIHYHTASSHSIHKRGRIVSDIRKHSPTNGILTATVYTGVN